VHGHEEAKGITMQRIVRSTIFPKFVKSFRRELTTKGFPRHNADTGVGTVESYRCHFQYHVLVERLREHSTQNLHHHFSSLSLNYT
jgi:phosphoribosyl 1,2-cyclic phosphodiesterase